MKVLVSFPFIFFPFQNFSIGNELSGIYQGIYPYLHPEIQTRTCRNAVLMTIPPLRSKMNRDQ